MEDKQKKIEELDIKLHEIWKEYTDTHTEKRKLEQELMDSDVMSIRLTVGNKSVSFPFATNRNSKPSDYKIINFEYLSNNYGGVFEKMDNLWLTDVIVDKENGKLTLKFEQ